MRHAHINTPEQKLYLKLEGLFSLQSLDLLCVFQSVLLYILLFTHEYTQFYWVLFFFVLPLYKNC